MQSQRILLVVSGVLAYGLSGCLVGCAKDATIDDKIKLMKAGADIADQLDADFTGTLNIDDSPSVGMKQDFYLHHGLSGTFTLNAEGKRESAGVGQSPSSPALEGPASAAPLSGLTPQEWAAVLEAARDEAHDAAVDATN